MLRFRRIPEGLETPDRRYAVLYLLCDGGPYTVAWCAVDRTQGRKVPCDSQQEARRLVAQWVAADR